MNIKSFIDEQKHKLRMIEQDPMFSQECKDNHRQKCKDAIMAKKQEIIIQKLQEVNKTLEDLQKKYKPKEKDPLQFLAERTRLRDALSIKSDDDVKNYLNNLTEDRELDEVIGYCQEAKERGLKFGNSDYKSLITKIELLNLDAKYKNDPLYQATEKVKNEFELQAKMQDSIWFDGWQDDPSQIKPLDELLNG